MERNDQKPRKLEQERSSLYPTCPVVHNTNITPISKAKFDPRLRDQKCMWWWNATKVRFQACFNGRVVATIFRDTEEEGTTVCEEKKYFALL